MKQTALALSGAWLNFTALCAKAAESERTELEWSALVPDNHEAPLILPAREADGRYPEGPDSRVHALDGRRISLPGHIVPLDGLPENLRNNMGRSWRQREANQKVLKEQAEK